MGGHATIHGASDSETRTGGGIKWVPVKVSGEGAAHVYGLAQNLVVQAAGTYNTTNVLGFICTAPGTGDWTIDPVGGASVGGIDAATFTAGQIYPVHAESITVGTGGEAVLFIPAV